MVTILTKRQRAALRKSEFHPTTVAAIARESYAHGDAAKARALYRSILETHPRCSHSAEALNFLMLHKAEPPPTADDSDHEWTRPPPRRRPPRIHFIG